MADPAVQQYLMIAMALGQTPNTAIVDTSTQDYQSSLSGEALVRAVYEVNLGRWAQTVQQWNALLVQAARVNVVADQASDAATDAAAAFAAASSASSDAASALSAAAAAQTAVNEISGLESRAVIRAPSWSSTTVAAGSGPRTRLPFPASTLEGSPLTRPTTAFSLTSGVLEIDDPGVYRYSLRGSLTTGLLTAGTVRVYTCIGSALASGSPSIDHAAEHSVTVALLSAPSSLSGSGVFEVPEGGAELALFGGHGALLGASLTLANVELVVERVSLLD